MNFTHQFLSSVGVLFVPGAGFRYRFGRARAALILALLILAFGGIAKVSGWEDLDSLLMALLFVGPPTVLMSITGGYYLRVVEWTAAAVLLSPIPIMASLYCIRTVLTTAELNAFVANMTPTALPIVLLFGSTAANTATRFDVREAT